jgi:hypothetical protein
VGASPAFFIALGGREFLGPKSLKREGEPLVHPDPRRAEAVDCHFGLFFLMARNRADSVPELHFTDPTSPLSCWPYEYPLRSNGFEARLSRQAKHRLIQATK